MILQKSTHSGRAVTDVPIIGVLTQPFRMENEDAPDTQGSFISTSDVKFLESAGARVVPVDFKMNEHNLIKLLE